MSTSHSVRPDVLAHSLIMQIQGLADFAEPEELLHMARRMTQMAEDLRFAASADAAAQPRRRLAFNLMAQIQVMAAMVDPADLGHLAWLAMQSANTVAHHATVAGAHRRHIAEQLAEFMAVESGEALPDAA